MQRIIQSPFLSEEEKITLLENALISVTEKVTDMDMTQNRHHKLLIEGNGDLPILEKVRNLEAFQNSLKFWLKTIAVAVALQTITFSGAALVYFLKLYPVLERISHQ